MIPLGWMGLAVLLAGAQAPDAGTKPFMVVFLASPDVDPALAATLREAVFARAQAEGPVLDASEQHRALTAPTLFVDFSRPPPAFWPASLAGQWSAGNDACARQTGPTGEDQPPGVRAAAAAVATACAEALRLAQWDLYVDHLAPRRVLEVEVTAPAGSRPDLAFAAASYVPAGQRRAAQVARVTPARAPQQMGELLEATLGTGRSGAVSVSTHVRRPLPSIEDPGAAVPAPGRPERTPGVVSVPSSCRRSIPAHLQVFPLGPASRILEASYRSGIATAPSISRTKPLRCDLVLFMDPGPKRPGTLHARLSCTGAQHRASASLENGRDGAVQSLIAQLTRRALAAFCAG